MTLTQEQIDARSQGIGGSDAGAILGLNKYKTPLMVYQEKVGDTEPEDLSDNDAVHFGNVLEDVIAKEYTRRTGLRVRRSNQIQVHPKHDWMIGHLDRKVEGVDRILECKTAGAHMASEWGEAGTDEVPESYLCQVQHYLAVTGFPEADLAVLIGGRDFRIYPIKRNQRLIDALTEIEWQFWDQHVMRRQPPDPVTIQDISRRWPRDNGNSRTCDSETLRDLAVLTAYKRQIKGAAEKREELEGKIKTYMKDATSLVDEDGVELATWKTQSRKVLDQKGIKAAEPELIETFTVKQETRVFRMKKIHEEQA